jgi:hypothetical protein
LTGYSFHMRNVQCSERCDGNFAVRLFFLFYAIRDVKKIGGLSV